MGTLNGFEIETPQEVMGRMQEQIFQQQGANNPNARNAANSQQVINALFGTPEVRKAQATETALSEAMSSVKKKSNESEAEFQVRQNTAVRTGLAGINPEVAMQANDKIVRLQSEALAQKRLKVGLDSDELDLANSLQTTVDAKTPYIFKRNANGDTTAVAGLPADATPEEINAKLNELQQGDPANSYVVGSGLDRLQLEGLRTNRFGGLNKSDLGEIESMIGETAVLMRNGGTFLTQMIEAPLSLTSGAVSFADTGSLIQGVRRIAGAYIQSDDEANRDGQLVQDVLERSGALEQMEDLGIESGVSRGIVLNMAYTLAKTLDPGGRLSDQDVEMAIQMITGNGDPTAIKKLLRIRLEAAAFAAEGHQQRATSGGLNGSIGLEAYNRFEAERDNTYALLDQFDEIIDAGGLAQHHRGVFGKSEQERIDTASESGTPKVTFTVTPR